MGKKNHKQKNHSKSRLSKKSETCKHGSTLDEAECKRRDAINDYLERNRNLFHQVCSRLGRDPDLVTQLAYNVDVKPGEPNHYDVYQEMNRVQTRLFDTYWAVHSHLVDEKMEKLLLSSATSCILNDDRRQAMAVANILAQMIDRHPNMQTNKGGPILYNAGNKCGTYRGVIMFVSKRIPCSCLAQLREKTKPSAKMDSCHMCAYEDVKERFFRCAGCKKLSYCSRECQKAHWHSEHKQECDTFALLNKEKEARVF